MTSTATGPRSNEHIIVFCAACSGSMRLSGVIGRPLVYVGAALDPDIEMRRLNERQHGSGVRWPDSFQPVGFESGWADWRLFPVDPVQERCLPPPAGVQVADGRILVPLPAGTTLPEFQAELAAALRHLRLQDVCIRPDYLEERSEMLADVLVHPRYTPMPLQGGADFLNCRLVTDLVALDPAVDARRLLWLVIGAKLAASEGRPGAWR